MTRLDYAVLYGGPLLFLLIAWLMIRMLLGPVPKPDALRLIREGKVRVGANAQTVLNVLGEPKDLIEHEDGSITFRYVKTVWDNEAAIEEGIVEIGASGVVTAVRSERRAVGPGGVQTEPAPASK